MYSFNPDELPETLEFTGEFGLELVTFLPFCAWLSRTGMLRNKRIKTYHGMRCFYEDLDCLEFIEKSDQRRHVPAERRPFWLPIKDEHSFDHVGRSPFHYYPDMRKKLPPSPLLFKLLPEQKELLIIHNKYTDEWGVGPVNHISLETLDILFEAFKERFAVVYIRHGMAPPVDGYSEDHNTNLAYNDRNIVDRHKGVLCFDDLYGMFRQNGGDADINKFKSMLYGQCYRFITSQGGGVHQIAMFGGSLIAVLHRQGQEVNWEYGEGYYGFIAPVTPTRLISRKEEELLTTIPVFLNSTFAVDRVHVDPRDRETLEKLSPFTIGKRH